jgi:ankyrin repeat protein
MTARPGRARSLLIPCALLLALALPGSHAAGATATFFDAARDGDLETVRLKVSEGTDVRQPDPSGWTALHLAAGQGRPAVVAWLLDKGADANATAGDGSTPLHSAAAAEKADPAAVKEVVTLLLANGAKPNARDSDGRTPLHMARSGTVVSLLADAGGDVNAKNKRGETPLIVTPTDDAAAALIAHGASAKCADQDNRTPLRRAVAGDWVKVAGWLLDKGADVDWKDDAGWAPLHLASSREMAELLLKRGANVDAVSLHGVTPLHGAAKHARVEVTRVLLAAGAEPDARDAGSRTPLSNAAAAPGEGGTACCKLLLDKGADPNAPDAAGFTPLHKAALAGCKENVELLLARRAKPNAAAEDATTPLHWASSQAIVDLLVASGADPLAKDKSGRTPAERRTVVNTVQP